MLDLLTCTKKGKDRNTTNENELTIFPVNSYANDPSMVQISNLVSKTDDTWAVKQSLVLKTRYPLGWDALDTIMLRDINLGLLHFFCLLGVTQSTRAASDFRLSSMWAGYNLCTSHPDSDNSEIY